MDPLRELFLELPKEERLAKLAAEDWIANIFPALSGELSLQIQDGQGEELFDKETLDASLDMAGLDPSQGLSAMDALGFETWYADPTRAGQLGQLGISDLSAAMQEEHPATKEIQRISEMLITEINGLFELSAFSMKKNEVYRTLKAIFGAHRIGLEKLYKTSAPKEESLGSTAKR